MIRGTWNNPFLLYYVGGMMLGASATIMILFMFNQVDGRPLFLTAMSMAVTAALLLERGFRVMVERDQRLTGYIEALQRQASTPWADR